MCTTFENISFQAGITPEIIAALYNDDVQQQLYATQKFRKLLSRGRHFNFII